MPDIQPRPELTARVVVIGLTLAVVMGAANVYLGLKAGMTVSASIPAAVVGALLLRLFTKQSTLLEANQIQTTASAGESLAAGIIFTTPALVLIGVWERFDFVTTTLIAFTGGLLGVLLMIPMRKVFVVDNDELPYPEGVACAAVLETSDRSGGDRGDAISVIWGAGVGAIFKFCVSFAGIIRGSLEGALATGSGRILFIGSDISPALVAVGFIVRLNVAVLIAIGGAIGWLICIPLYPEINALLAALSPQLAYPLTLEGAPVDRAWTLWSSGIRYVGVGAMVVGGISSIFQVRRGLARAIEEIASRFGDRGDPSRSATGGDHAPDVDLPTAVLAGLILLTVFLIAGIYYHFTGGIGITLLSTAVMLVMSFFFVAVASYIVGLVGNSNSPVSGMTITAVLFTGAMLWMFGFSGTSGMVATLGVAAIVCCAACTSGDVCNDLKTGSLVGATPRKQQIMQIAGVAIASLVMAPVLQLLHEAYTIGSRELSAPQATLFANLVRGFFGDGSLPWGLVGIGAAIGCVILAIDSGLARRGARFRAHLMPVAVGIYLPFGLSVPILMGGLLAHLHSRGAATPSEIEGRMQRGVLFASGIIAGESLVGVGIALLVSLGLSGAHPSFPFQGGVTAVLALATLGLFYARTRPASNR